MSRACKPVHPSRWQPEFLPGDWKGLRHFQRKKLAQVERYARCQTMERMKALRGQPSPDRLEQYFETLSILQDLVDEGYSAPWRYLKRLHNNLDQYLQFLVDAEMSGRVQIKAKSSSHFEIAWPHRSIIIRALRR